MKRIINWGKKAEGGDQGQTPAQAHDANVDKISRQLRISNGLLAGDRHDEIEGVGRLRNNQAQYERDLQKYQVPPGLITRHTSRGFRERFPREVHEHVKRVQSLSEEAEEKRRRAVSPLTDPRPFSIDGSDEYPRSSLSHGARPSYGSGRSFRPSPYSPAYNQSQFGFDFGQGANEDDQAPRAPRRSYSQDYLRSQQGPSSSGGQGQSSSQPFLPISSKVENLYNDGKLYTVYYDKRGARALKENGAYRII